MNDILLSGYYGFGNAGDEMILESAVLAFQKRGLKVAALSHTPQETSKRLGISAYERKGLRRILDAIRSSRLILSGGGGLFQDTTSYRSLAYYLRIPFLAKLLGKKTMIFAQGIGPIRTPLGKKFTRLVCNHFVDRITVRDAPSKETLLELGVKKEIRVTSDLALLHPAPSGEQVRILQNRFLTETRKRPFLGIVLRSWPVIENHFPSFSRAISTLAEKEKLTPVLISFQSGSDDQVLESFHRQLKVPHLRIPSALLPAELFALVAGLDFLVAMRYHALLFSARALVPCLGIAYDEKIKNLASVLGTPFVGAEGLSSDEFHNLLEKAWTERAKLKEQMEPRIRELALKAEGNIDIAVELLQR